MGAVGSTGLRILHFGDVHLPFPPGALRTPAVLHPKRVPALLNFFAARGRKSFPRCGTYFRRSTAAIRRLPAKNWICSIIFARRDP